MTVEEAVDDLIRQIASAPEYARDATIARVTKSTFGWLADEYPNASEEFVRIAYDHWWALFRAGLDRRLIRESHWAHLQSGRA
jgi:hypothetical protein